jgi:inorganic triphosphatase YgiF
VFNAIFSNISAKSWQPFLDMQEAGEVINKEWNGYCFRQAGHIRSPLQQIFPNGKHSISL